MCSTKAKRVTQEGGRQGKQDTADGRGREDAQHDGGGRPSMIVEGAPAGRGRGPQQDGEGGPSRSTERPTPAGDQQGL